MKTKSIRKTKPSIPEQPDESLRIYKGKISLSVELNYLITFPKGYHQSNKKYPLIYFLHGAGERGTDPEITKRHGPHKFALAQKSFPFIIVSPQCPLGSWWTEHQEALIYLLNHVCNQYRVDTQRVYLTGLSMGGEGTWKLGMTFPHRFAALIPICGKGIHSLAYRIKDKPIWVFHGDKDEIIPIHESIKMVDTLKSLKSKVKFTVYPGVGHDSWTATYSNPVIYHWLLKYKLKNK